MCIINRNNTSNMHYYNFYYTIINNSNHNTLDCANTLNPISNIHNNTPNRIFGRILNHTLNHVINHTSSSIHGSLNAFTIHSFIHSFICSSIYSSIFIYLFIYLFVCLFVYLSDRRAVHAVPPLCPHPPRGGRAWRRHGVCGVVVMWCGGDGVLWWYVDVLWRSYDVMIECTWVYGMKFCLFVRLIIRFHLFVCSFVCVCVCVCVCE